MTNFYELRSRDYKTLLLLAGLVLGFVLCGLLSFFLLMLAWSAITDSDPYQHATSVAFGVEFIVLSCFPVIGMCMSAIWFVNILLPESQ